MTLPDSPKFPESWPHDNWPCFQILTFCQSNRSIFILLTPPTTLTFQNPHTTIETLSCDDRLKQTMEFYQNNHQHSIWALGTQFAIAHSTLQDWTCSWDAETSLPTHTIRYQAWSSVFGTQRILPLKHVEMHWESIGIARCFWRSTQIWWTEWERV